MKINFNSNRSFGFFLLIVTSIILLWVYSHTGKVNKFFSFIILLILILSIFKPNFFQFFNICWQKVGYMLSIIFSPLIFIIIFFGLIFPISILLKIFKKDLLYNSFKDKTSYWKKEDKERINMTDQF